MRYYQLLLVSGGILLLVAHYAPAQDVKKPETHAGDKEIRACLRAIIDDLKKLKPEFPELCEFNAERLNAGVDLGPNFSWAVLDALGTDSSAPSKTKAEESNPKGNSGPPSKWSCGFDYQHNFTEGSPKYVTRKPEFGKDGCRFFVDFKDINEPSQLAAHGTIPALNVQYFYIIQLPPDGPQELRTKFDEIVLRHIDQLKKVFSQTQRHETAEKTNHP